MTGLTTASSRKIAQDFESRAEWRKAAEYYKLAHDLYPDISPSDPYQQLATADKSMLLSKSRECRRLADFEDNRPTMP